MPQIVVKLGENVTQKFAFDKPLILIGRALDNDLVIENLSVSRKHAQIELQNGKYIISDLNSANGTFVNAERIDKKSLKDQDIVTIGKHKLYFIEEIRHEEESLPASPFDFDKTVVVHRVDPCYFVILEGKPANQTYRINKPEAFVGRDTECDVVIHDWLAAKKHARLNLEGKNYILTDLGTWKGTKVNGQAIQERILLNKDEIQIGSTKIRFLTNISDSEYVSHTKSQHEAVSEKENLLKEKPSEKISISLPAKFMDSEGYVASTTSTVFHFPNCTWAKGIRKENAVHFATVGDAILSRRRSCVTCKPGMENKDVEFWIKISNDEDNRIRAHARKMIKKLTGKDHV